MPHIAQERYSSLVDEKLRATLVTKDNLIFNPRSTHVMKEIRRLERSKFQFGTPK